MWTRFGFFGSPTIWSLWGKAMEGTMSVVDRRSPEETWKPLTARVGSGWNQGAVPLQERDYFSKQDFEDLCPGALGKPGHNLGSTSKWHVTQLEEIWLTGAEGPGISQMLGLGWESCVWWRPHRLKVPGIYEDEEIGGFSLTGFRSQTGRTVRVLRRKRFFLVCLFFICSEFCHTLKWKKEF